MTVLNVKQRLTMLLRKTHCFQKARRAINMTPTPTTNRWKAAPA
jgi:hypothetical protein